MVVHAFLEVVVAPFPTLVFPVEHTPDQLGDSTCEREGQVEQIRRNNNLSFKIGR